MDCTRIQRADVIAAQKRQMKVGTPGSRVREQPAGFLNHGGRHLVVVEQISGDQDVWSDDLFAVLFQVGGQQVARGKTRPEHHIRLHDLATQFVGLAHHGDVKDGFVFEEGAFHFERADTVAGAFDDVGGAHQVVIG